MSIGRLIIDTVNWARPFLKNMDLAVSPVLQPAIDNANHVMQIMLSPPFAWPWNRKSIRILPADFVAGTQDIAIVTTGIGFLPDLGYLELVSIDGGDAGSSTGQLGIETSLASSSITEAQQKGRPEKICVLFDDNDGNVTFRVRPPSDAAYSMEIIYQKKPPIIVDLGAPWAPIPDEFAYIYDSGFLALGLADQGDGLFQYFNQQFISHLLARAQGLTELQKNIFLADWLRATQQSSAAALLTQRGQLT